LIAVKIQSIVPAPLAVLIASACLCWTPLHNPAMADDATARIAASCPLTAVVTADNDIRLDGDDRAAGKKAEIPAQVLSKLHAMAAGMLRKVESPDPYPGECEDIYRGVFRISAAPDIDLYVAEISPNYAARFFFLLLFDPATGAITGHPPRVSAKWTQGSGWKDPLLAKPLISFADLFGNHHRQIVVEERVHNGTMYNGVVYNYFDVGPGLSLTRVLAFERQVLTIGPDEGRIARSLKRAGPNQLRLDSVLEPQAKPRKRRALGYVILESPGPGSPFQVKQRHPEGNGSASILVTYAGADTSGGDDAFLREGYSFYY
jgi:hypothetical protein